MKIGRRLAGGEARRPRQDGTTFDLPKRKREHWAWQPVRPTAAAGRQGRRLAARPGRPLHPGEAGSEGPDARRRRPTAARCSAGVYFDLIGLPPTPDEVEAFLADDVARRLSRRWSIGCWRRRTSASAGAGTGSTWSATPRPRGHEFDYDIPNAYHYRDYVIRAFNADVPYDQFVAEHVAGDLLPTPRLHPTEGFNESILGTGFWFLGEEVHSPVDIRQDQADRFDNRIDVLTKTFLGLTVACARCHDHKFDAISTKDYYALSGFLESSRLPAGLLRPARSAIAGRAGARRAERRDTQGDDRGPDRRRRPRRDRGDRSPDRRRRRLPASVHFE